ncbi:CRISPR-associated endonuclease Cas3'' [Olsenella massiliensis]|uniref:CRISPR-associated endonuclease Cas3'' n=1 Tax=Olsenella massiliensis TaxID=1622075 RepID=UPI00071C7EF7|nr:CRISPR-associated endonuclease Cas3'' [Olsenella massiliensis]
MDISPQARSLWGKSDYGAGEAWLPLAMHMLDSLGVARLLWDAWLPQGTRETLSRPLGGDQHVARSLLMLLAGLHDLGKATPVFQSTPSRTASSWDETLPDRVIRAGLCLRADFAERRLPTHAVAGEALVRELLCARGWGGRAAKALASVIGSHHGTFPQQKAAQDARLLYAAEMGAIGRGSEEWARVRKELSELVICRASVSSDLVCTLSENVLPAPVLSLLAGIVTMADWLASNQELFPLFPLGEDRWDKRVSDAFLEARLAQGWECADLPTPWHTSRTAVPLDETSFRERFGLPAGCVLRPIQAAMVKIAREHDDLGIVVLEAPMGEGKTEAALAAAEIMCAHGGMGGICVALPTMATTDAMFGRVRHWLDRLPHVDGEHDKSVTLAHGKSQLNEEFQSIKAASRRRQGSARGGGGIEGDVFASDWMSGRKKGMLANFVVCTVDQALMGALDMRHLSLRQVALANKVVIIDECHAYDLYMRQYLGRLLEWLGYWHNPVILLSATLPSQLKKEMVDAYLAGRKASGAQFATRARRHRPVSRWAQTSPAATPPAELTAAATSSAAPTAAATPASVSPSLEGTARGDAYPLITYTCGIERRELPCATSGRGVSLSLALMADDESELVRLLEERLVEGGVAGVVCDTVARAQRVFQVVREAFGEADVLLDHARFIDLDRLLIERSIRSLLGPAATRANGRRPKRLVVVGTQVLEQSLDIDFDLLVTDVAPVDLIFQRLGRTHRHVRGDGEKDRPDRLRTARCYVRGITSWEGGVPAFMDDVTKVYGEATLMEALSVLDLTDAGGRRDLALPQDIAPLVRAAYSKGVSGRVPEGWQEGYQRACAQREKKRREKMARARVCLLHSAVSSVTNEWNLDDLASSHCLGDAADLDAGERAVRDTQETVEVLLLRQGADGVSLLPWVGDDRRGILPGASVPVHACPEPALARLVAQGCVRLPLSLCNPQKIDLLIRELEDKSGEIVSCWQDSPWLAGRIALLMREEKNGLLVTTILGQRLEYSAQVGLQTVCG